MFPLRPLALASCLAFLLNTASPAATNPHVDVRPQAQILKKVDTADLTLRPHTTTARIAQATDQGRIDANTRFSHMMLVLRSTDEQEFALATLLDAQQDKSSPNYHQWMTPDTFGNTFGVAGTDLAQITAWLEDSGFTVDSIAKGARIIQFSGTSGQVEAAFHTEMHTWLVNGEIHVANSTDISIPTALGKVVLGIRSLNDFKPHANLVNPRRLLLGKEATGTPDYTSTTSSNHYTGAGDLATIFNTKPLLAAGINGAGVTIGILGQTDIILSDVQIYRSLFNLPKNDPIFIQVGADPGTIPDDGESDLDVELSGAIAPMATINFYTSGNSYFGGGVDASAIDAVETNTADIISLSYGDCEADLGSSGNAFYNTLWEQAASQGQTVFVSSGDSGPSTCSSSNAPYSTTGYGVNGNASTPFNVAVGGTMFNDGTATGATSYWSAPAGPPYSTALSYIPEIPWNEGRFDIYPNGLGGIVGGGSGISLYYGTPSFQAGPGVPTSDPTPNSGTVSGFVIPGPHRYLPDVSLQAAAAHDATIYCSEGSCQLNADGTVAGIGLVGGTSVAAPSLAGVQALINQKNGGRQGNANYYYYRVAATQSQTNCISSTYVTTADTTCGFHDITTGNTNIPRNSAGTTILGWNAGAGYDLAVGLGSPDVTNLATRWSTVTFNATTTALTLTPATGVIHGAAQTVTVAVSSASGSGTPTGDVSLIVTTPSGGTGTFTQLNGITGGTLSFTLSSGSASGTLKGLPAGAYTVYAHYAGDSTYGGSNSAPISVTISPEDSNLTVKSYLLNDAGANANATFSYGDNVYLDATVAGVSATGVPGGNVTFTLANGSAAPISYVAPLDSTADAYFDAGLGQAAYDIMPTSPVLPPGRYTVTASYSGDASFHASTGTPINFTISPLMAALNLSTATVQLPPNLPAIFNVNIATASPAAGGVPATGSVTFTDATTRATLGTAVLVNGAAVFSTNAITTPGAHTIGSSYSGDANYAAGSSSSVVVTVAGRQAVISLSASTLSAPVGTGVTLTATVPLTATGSVSFYDAGVFLGTVAVPTSTFAAITISTFTARTHAITATYSGDTSFGAGTANAVNLTITQNLPTVQLTAQQSNASNSTVAMNAVLTPSPRGSNLSPTGLVRFLDGTTVLGTAPPVYLPGGYNNYVATFTTQALQPGPHTLTATYLGDTNFATAGSNAQTVNIGLTTPTLTTSTTSVGTGVPFTLTDRIVPQVAGASAVSGTVTFYDAATLLGTATVSSGIATLSRAILIGVGPHTITATYSGDANFYTSTTSPTSINVVQTASTTTLAVSATTIQLGASVTLTATAPANATGTVTFFDNTVSLGTATLSGSTSSAFLVVPNLGVRTHSITATYNGDPNFLASTSAATLITVTQASSTTILTASATTAQLGTSVTLTATSSASSTGTITFFDNGVSLGTVPLAGATPTASLLVTSFGARTHPITAMYNGDTNFVASTSAIVMIAVTQNTPTLQLGTLQSISTSSTLTLNATLVRVPAGQSGTPSPTGFIQYSDGTSVLGSSPVVPLTDGTGNYAAPFTTAILKPGPHSITAAYTGDTNYAPAVSAAQSFTLGLTATSLTASPSTAQVGATIILTATVSAPATGTITFFDNGVSLGTATIAGAAASLSIPTFAARTHSLTATYNGDTNYYTSASASTVLTITQNTPVLQLVSLQNTSATPSLTIIATLTPVPFGTKPANPPPSGSIQYSDGATAIGSVAVTTLADGSTNYGASLTTSSLRPGTHSISAAYTGDLNYAPALAPSQTVNLGLTTIALTSSAAIVGLGTPFTLTAKITPILPSAATIGGSVTFSDGTTLLGTSNVSAGVASITASLAASASATHTVTAVYSGDTNFFTSTSAGIAITTVTPSVAVSISPSSLTITRGSSGSAVISVTTTGNYSGTITPACTGLPSLATCTFSPASLLFNGVNGTQTTTITIATTAPTTSSSLLWLPALLLGGLVTMRRKQLTVRTRHLAVLAFVLAGFMAVTGCGSSIPAPTTTMTGGTPVGNSTITVNLSAVGSTSSSPTTQTTATLSITIQ